VRYFKSVQTVLGKGSYKMNKKNEKITKSIDIGENEQYDNSIEILTKNFPIKFANQLGALFLQEEFNSMNVDTFIKNVAQVSAFFKKRNKGILKKDEAYVSEDDIINLIKRYPRIASQDNGQLLEEKEEILQELDFISEEELNILMKESKGYFYSIGNEKMYRTLTFLNEIEVLTEDEERKNAAKYLLQDLGEANLQMSTEKIFQRILHIVTNVSTNIIPAREFDFCFKRKDEEYEKRYGKSKEDLDRMYILPRTEDRKEYKQKIKYIVERQSKIYEKTRKEKGEE